ncbi:hypothetical protein AOLI_G00064590 [Acnodon oligacanthus]
MEGPQGLDCRSRTNPASGTLSNLTEREQPWPSVCLSTDLASLRTFWKPKESPLQSPDRTAQQPPFIRTAHALFCGLIEHKGMSERS